jgi:hypothetical protein
MKPETLIYTHSNAPYGHFVLPFIYFALMADESYSVEVWACDSDVHKSGVDWLNEEFGDRALLVETNSARPNESRFRFPPRTRTAYTYISDIDILTLDPHIREWHVGNLDDRCFSNAIRKPETWEKLPRLSGLMFVLTDEWYAATEQARRAEWEGSDEMVLAQIAFSVFPESRAQLERKPWARPVHGIHMSMQREPDGSPHWEITSRWIQALKRMEKHKTWPEFWRMTSDKWKEQYKRIK